MHSEESLDLGELDLGVHGTSDCGSRYPPVPPLETDSPDTPPLVQDFLKWVINCAKRGSTAAVVAAVSLMSNDVLHQLAQVAR